MFLLNMLEILFVQTSKRFANLTPMFSHQTDCLSLYILPSDLLVSVGPGLLDEELDYDENMDELDLYPTGSLDVGGGIEEGHGRRPSKSATAASGDEEGEERGSLGINYHI